VVQPPRRASAHRLKRTVANVEGRGMTRTV
jgi:hypothetical protein